MDRSSLDSQFIDYYLNENRIKNLDGYSREISMDTIMGVSSEYIVIGSNIISIPEEIKEKDFSNNIKIDAFTNDTQEIYYLNPELKKYYKIGNDINVGNFNLKNNENLLIDFKYHQNNNLIENFIIIEFSERQGIEARQYRNLNQVRLSPHKEISKMKIYIKPLNDGFIYDINFQIKKVQMNEITNHNLPVNEDIIYNPDKRVSLYAEDEELSIVVPDINKDFIYFSYAIDNNSFNKIPGSSLIDVNPDNLYQIHTPFSVIDEVDFTPTIIEYNKKGKTNLIKLKSDARFLKLQRDTSAIRLSYRFSGSGKVHLGNVSIREFEPETAYEAVEWSSRFEIDKYMNTIENVENLRISVIMDEFTYHSYKYEANLQRLTFDNWKNEIISFMPHFIFIESSWHGNEGDWSKKIAYVTDEKHSYIKNLISFAKSLDIPVVFWNKEDPVHYEHFIETAKLCDYVFTTDSDRVPYYKRDCNHENVDVLQFAAQPATHNPVEIQKERIDGISFAGSYYALREERSNDMNRLFRASIPYNLHIYDRNYEATQKGEKLNFLFPEEFRKYILGSLPFYQIDKAYKGYKFMININTVKTSPTMFARRVYEGLASGTPIISNYSLGMEKQFGDLIGYSENEDDLISYLNHLNNNESEYNKTKQLGIRRVLSEHTYAQRLSQITNNIGYELNNEDATVTFLSFLDDESDIEKAIEIYNNFNYDNKYLLIFVKNNIISYSILNQNITVISEENLNQYFMTLDQLVKSNYVAPIDIEDFYGENYLVDLLMATSYTYAEVVGKKDYYMNDNSNLREINESSEHEYTDFVNSFSSIIKSDIFSNLNIIDSLEYLRGLKPFSELKYLGVNIYSSDKMNYIKSGSKLDKALKYKVVI